jgi:hypothetical protein
MKTWLENKMALFLTQMGECRKKWLNNKMARVVTEPNVGLRKTWLENKFSM